MESLNNKKKELNNELENIGSNDSKKEKEELIKNMNEFLSFKNPSRELLVNLIDKIELSQDKTVEINYKFRID